MNTIKGSKSRITDHQAARATLDRVFPDKAKPVQPPAPKPAPVANPFPHIKIP